MLSLLKRLLALTHYGTMMKTLTFLIFLFSILSMSSLSKAEQFTIGVEKINYFPFFQMENKEMKLSFFKEVMDSYGSQKGHTFKYVEYPLSELTKALWEGKIDFRYPDNPAWLTGGVLKDNIFYSVDVVTFIEGLMVTSARSGTSIDTIRSIGTIKGYTPWPYVDRIKRKLIQHREFENAYYLIKNVSDGAIDAAFINVSVAEAILRESDLEGSLIFARHLPYLELDSTLSTRFHRAIIHDFSDYLLRSRGQLAALKQKYLIQDLMAYPYR